MPHAGDKREKGGCTESDPTCGRDTHCERELAQGARETRDGSHAFVGGWIAIL